MKMRDYSHIIILSLLGIVMQNTATEIQDLSELEKVYPADTTEIRITTLGIPILKNNDFSHFTQLESLWLNNKEDNGGLKHIESNAFHNTQLRNLNLVNNAIEKFPNLIMNANSLQHVNLTGNEIQEVKCEYLQGLVNLITLDLSENLLTTVPGACTATAELLLQELYLDHNPRLIFVTEESLQGLINIRKVTLVHTNIGQLGLDNIVSKLSAINELVVKKVRVTPGGHRKSTFQSEIQADMPDNNADNKNQWQKHHRLRRSVSASNTTNDNMTLTQYLDNMYSEFQKSLGEISKPVEGPNSHYIGFTYIALLALENALFLYIDIMGCILVCIKYYKRKYKKKNNKSLIDDRRTLTQHRRGSAKLGQVHPFVTVPNQVENTLQLAPYYSQTGYFKMPFPHDKNPSNLSNDIRRKYTLSENNPNFEFGEVETRRTSLTAENETGRGFTPDDANRLSPQFMHMFNEYKDPTTAPDELPLMTDDYNCSDQPTTDTDKVESSNESKKKKKKKQVLKGLKKEKVV